MNFLGIGPMELLVIVVLALIVLGPEKLPEVMAQVGKAMDEFRKATTQLSDEFNRTIQAELKETRAVTEEAKDAFREARSTVNEAVTGTPAPRQSEVPPVDETAVPAMTNAADTSPQPDLHTTPEAITGTTSTAHPEQVGAGEWEWDTAVSSTRK
jgi:sec-independent protein translocase protein TatB